METAATTQLAVIKPEELDVIVKQSGLEMQEGEKIKQSYQPFLVQLAEIHEQAGKINFTAPTELDESIARNLRLKTVKIRTDSEKLKDSRKRGYLLRGNLEQAAYNLIAATCKVAENEFTNVEKAREIAEAKRIEALRVERTAELLQWNWIDSGVMNIGKLDNATYNAMLAGLKKAHEDRIAEEKRIEEERIAAAKKAEEERLAMIAENERLRKEARKEREAFANKFVEAGRIAAKKLAAQQAEAKRLADELRTKQLQEQAERQKKEREEEARIAAEKKAAAAPDKEKLKNLISIISIPQRNYSTEHAVKIDSEIRAKFNSFKAWANQLIDTL